MKLFRHFTDKTQGVRRSGSAAIDLCHVASGLADGFWEFDLKPWDTAAGILIAKEAGCMVKNLNGGSYSIYDNNILVTNNGPLDLTKNVPIEVEEIEMLMMASK